MPPGFEPEALSECDMGDDSALCGRAEVEDKDIKKKVQTPMLLATQSQILIHIRSYNDTLDSSEWL